MRLAEFDPYFSFTRKGAMVEDMLPMAPHRDIEPIEDDLFEMANLVQAQTGIAGVIYISTSQGSHGPRVKFFLKPGKGQPSFSVSIGPDPEVVANSLPEKTKRDMSPLITGWVRMNYAALQQFWDHGTDWTDPQVTAFKQSLKKYSFESDESHHHDILKVDK
jgi:hypothetical protein